MIKTKRINKPALDIALHTVVRLGISSDHHSLIAQEVCLVFLVPLHQHVSRHKEHTVHSRFFHHPLKRFILKIYKKKLINKIIHTRIT